MTIKTRQWQVFPDKQHLVTADVCEKNHFEWLNPQDSGSSAKLFDYPDLFREAADCLREVDLHNKALTFYKPLQRVDDYLDFSYFIDMATCQKALGFHEEATHSYQKFLENSRSTDDAHQKMPKCRRLDKSDMGEPRAIKAGPPPLSSSYGCPNRIEALKQTTDISILDITPFTMIAPRLPRLATRNMISDKVMDEKLRDERSSLIFARMLTFIKKARSGDVESRNQWMELAKTLIHDFRSKKAFFPSDKQLKINGFSREARKKPLGLDFEQGLIEAKYRKGRVDCPVGQFVPTWVPTEESFMVNGDFVERDLNCGERNQTEFRGIKYDSWLDILLEYALTLALSNDMQGGYEIISSALNANVFHHSPHSMFLIHVCWFSK